jgi:hypothetical protein
LKSKGFGHGAKNNRAAELYREGYFSQTAEKTSAINLKKLVRVLRCRLIYDRIAEYEKDDYCNFRGIGSYGRIRGV